MKNDSANFIIKYGCLQCLLIKTFISIIKNKPITSENILGQFIIFERDMFFSYYFVEFNYLTGVQQCEKLMRVIFKTFF